ncbi:MAG: MBL fold metallo-hydrolase [Solirubrobacteraceae bacterium]|nr:MBL fold metallo-hydrolase [Solirubrobacteraceae bacterium]
MTQTARKRELGRGERVLPGVWRLRLPLPWPGVPHGNAWALAAGDGIVLVDTGIHEPGSMDQLVRALDQVNLKLEHIKLLVCTHAHSDHYGQAATIVDQIGCELWMHPAYEDMVKHAEDPEGALNRRLEIALQSGVPEAPLRKFAEERKGANPGIARVIAPDRPLVPGVEIETDLGTWTVHNTPGHAPNHVCLFQPEHRLLISGDHLLGRVSLFFDHGYTPDPAGEFLASLDVVEGLDARLCLAGHGRTFSDLQAHIDANRKLVHERLDAAERVVSESGPISPFDAAFGVYGEAIKHIPPYWWTTKMIVYMEHLEVTGRVRRITESGEPDRFVKP